MRENSNPKNLYLLLFFVFACIMAIAVVWAASGFTPYNVSLNNEPAEAYNSGWKYWADGQEISIDHLPATVDVPEGSVTIYNTLPEEIPAGAALNIETNHQTIVVQVDQDMVYEHGGRYDAAFGKSFGHIWNCIRIPKDSGSKTVALTITNPYGRDTVSIGDILIGSKSAIVMELAQKSIPTILFCLFVFLLGAAFFFASFSIGIFWPQLEIRSFLYLGLFAMFAALWVATDAKILQFIGGNEVVGYLTSYFMFFLMPIPFLLYIKCSCNEHARMFDALCILFLLNFFICVSLHILNLVDLVYTIYTTHVLIVLSMIAVVCGCVRAYRRSRNRDMIWILIALSILSLAGVGSLVWFYLSNGGDYSSYFRYGFLLFIALLSVNACRRAGAVINESLAADAYKRMAYIDFMTMLANRTSFDLDLEGIQREMRPGNRVTVLSFDLNNLKTVNDTQGHSYGDVLIRGFANHLKKVFEPAGKCYRVGGDEFAVILKNKCADFMPYIQDLEQRVYNGNKKQDGAYIEYAWGSASAVMAADGPLDMKSLYKEADAAMYANKTKMREAGKARLDS